MKIIKLSRGKQVLIDETDYLNISQYRWQAHFTNGNCYARRNCRLPNGRKIKLYLHRQILGLRHGDTRQVDHINGNGLDNRRHNLRICTVAENSANRRAVKSRSGYKGVSKCGSKSNPFQARIQLDGQIFSMGCFKTPQEAAWAYDFGLLMLYGEFACTNQSLGLL
ncbi:MAG: hypothetical protein GY869_07990 [Planctomycetes bacterium]|nr:hypothetical protein [Planctomycetota bacterium]